MLAENIRKMVSDSHVKGVELGRLEGREEGVRNTIISFATVQWGKLSHELLAKLDYISSVEQLETMSLLLFRAKSLQEFENIVEDAVKKSMQ